MGPASQKWLLCGMMCGVHILYYSTIIMTVYCYYDAASMAAKMAKDGITNFDVNSRPLVYVVCASVLHAVISMLDVYNVKTLMEMEANAKTEIKIADEDYVRIAENKDVCYALPFNSTPV